MLLNAIAGAALLFSGTPAEAADTHGKLPWFEGTYAELLAKAEKENKLVFLDFWTDW